jgi:hypothetical protein
VARAARGADGARDVQDDVLRADAGADVALDAHLHRLRGLEQQGLRRQNMLDLARPDAKGERADAAVARRVAVAANDRCAGQRKTLFGADDMNDALLGRDRVDVTDAELGRVLLQRRQLRRAFGVGDRQPVARRILARRRRHIMVGHRERQVGAAHRAAARAKPGKGLRAGDFMDEVAVDEDQAGAVAAPFDDMRVPDFFVKRAGPSHAGSLTPPA